MYMVTFNDKKIYTEQELKQFVSPKALERRGGFVSPEDAPLKESYLKALSDSGFEIRGVSRWLNSALVLESAKINLTRLKSWPMVSQVEPMGIWHSKSLDGHTLYQPDEYLNELRAKEFRPENQAEGLGLAFEQIQQVKGVSLLKNSKVKKFPTIAVLDAGFYQAHLHRGLQYSFAQGNVLGTRDLIAGDTLVFEDDDHGLKVWSIMAGNDSPYFIGSAPHAQYWLLRTEDAKFENPAEMFWWVMGAEFADSVGADMIVSSLGYSTFDDRALDLTESVLDGNSTIIAKGARMALIRKLWVVVSNGNEGESNWKTLTTPADVDGVISVGSVDVFGQVSGFSSIGATKDGRVKPDFLALGDQTYLASTGGWYTTGSGTSYASPIIAGLISHLLTYTHDTGLIYRALRVTATDPQGNVGYGRGYGLPNFEKAEKYIQFFMQKKDSIPEIWSVMFLPDKKVLELCTLAPLTWETGVQLKIRVKNKRGMVVEETMLPVKAKSEPEFRFEVPISKKMKRGIYTIEIYTPEQQFLSSHSFNAGS